MVGYRHIPCEFRTPSPFRFADVYCSDRPTDSIVTKRVLQTDQSAVLLPPLFPRVLLPPGNSALSGAEFDYRNAERSVASVLRRSGCKACQGAAASVARVASGSVGIPLPQNPLYLFTSERVERVERVYNRKFLGEAVVSTPDRYGSARKFAPESF